MVALGLHSWAHSSQEPGTSPVEDSFQEMTQSQQSTEVQIRSLYKPEDIWNRWTQDQEPTLGEESRGVDPSSGWGGLQGLERV